MELRDVKRYINRLVQAQGSPYRLTAVIFRRNASTGEDYYQAELTDIRNGNSVVICALEQVEKEETTT